MNNSTKFLVWLMFILTIGIGVHAALTYPGYDVRPSQGTVLTSTSVNFSHRINNTNDGNNSFEFRVYNRSSTTGNYSILYGGNVTNATFHNKTVTLANGNRHYWFVNYTNASGGSPVLSSVYIFNVDVNYYKLTFGSQQKINMSLDSGNLSIAGQIIAQNLSLVDVGGNRRTCGINGSSGGTNVVLICE